MGARQRITLAMLATSLVSACFYEFELRSSEPTPVRDVDPTTSSDASSYDISFDESRDATLNDAKQEHDASHTRDALVDASPDVRGTLDSSPLDAWVSPFERCREDGSCPNGYRCMNIQNGARAAEKQCAPSSCSASFPVSCDCFLTLDCACERRQVNNDPPTYTLFCH